MRGGSATQALKCIAPDSRLAVTRGALNTTPTWRSPRLLASEAGVFPSPPDRNRASDERRWWPRDGGTHAADGRGPV